MRLGISRSNRERLLVLANRFLGSAKQVKRVAEVVASFGISRGNRKCLLVNRNRIIQAAEPLQSVAEVIVGFRKIRPEGDCSFVVPDCFLGILGPRQGKGEVVVRVGGTPVYLHRATEQSRRLLKSALLQPDQPQMIQRREVAFVRLENDFIKPFRLPQQPLLLKSHCLPKRLLRLDGLPVDHRRYSAGHNARPSCDTAKLAKSVSLA